MIEEPDALAAICTTTPEAVVEEIAIAAATGRVLAGELRATVAIPRFDQSSMDGYALRAEDVESGLRRFTVVGRAEAGAVDLAECSRGQAVRVFTGAPIPVGADTVVMQEDVVTVSAEEVELVELPSPGEFVRHEGDVLCPGQVIGRRGDLVSPALLALLASQGIESLPVGRRPQVAVITTGDELVHPGEALRDHQIYNSNGIMLASAIKATGGEVVELLHARDDLEGTVAVFQRALDAAEIVLVAGGVSVGDRDFVRPAAEAVGCEQVFWRVNVKPGKPLYYGIAPGGKQVFGLPGNPVSALVCFALFALPAIRRRAGRGDESCGLKVFHARLAEPIQNRASRPHYVRGSIRAGEFVLQGVQESHGLSGLARADGLVRVAPESALNAGDAVEVRSLGLLAGSA